MGQKTASWCLTSFQFLAYDTSKLIKVRVVLIFSPKIVHWSDQNYTLEWIKVGNDMMSDTTNGPSNWELVSRGAVLAPFFWVNAQAFTFYSVVPNETVIKKINIICNNSLCNIYIIVMHNKQFNQSINSMNPFCKCYSIRDPKGNEKIG